jgi:hypothetical protein
MTDSDSDDSITSEDDVIARPILDANWRYEFCFALFENRRTSKFILMVNIMKVEFSG